MPSSEWMTASGAQEAAAGIMLETEKQRWPACIQAAEGSDIEYRLHPDTPAKRFQPQAASRVVAELGEIMGGAGTARLRVGPVAMMVLAPRATPCGCSAVAS
jgi:hypothetical protein